MQGSPPPENMRPTRMNWDRPPWNRHTFQRIREFLPTAPILRGTAISSLADGHTDIDAITFQSENGPKTIAQMVDDTYTDGMLIWLDGKIIHERYHNGMSRRSLHLCQSVSKSITATACASLFADGLMDQNAPISEYLPELTKTAWSGATVQHVLDMATGITYDETYERPDSDMGITDYASGWKPAPPGVDASDWPTTIWDQILSLKDQEVAHGSHFNYRSIETDVLAHAMERVTRQRLPQIVSERLWAPLGAEEDANITVDPAGYGLACGGISASLRDFARFGIAMLNDGQVGGRQVIPRAWVDDVRGGAHGHFDDYGRNYFPNGHYRNMFWIEDNTKQAHLCLGVFGQTIYVSPERGMVAVKLSTWPEFTNASHLKETMAALHAIGDAFGCKQ
ncbi:beta-lactamase family protein [Amylibacter sp.]|nr:beta-lactamase family protein [Amylibacter sp.]